MVAKNLKILIIRKLITEFAKPFKLLNKRERYLEEKKQKSKAISLEDMSPQYKLQKKNKEYKREKIIKEKFPTILILENIQIFAQHSGNFP